jgi:general secretion pathway protein J
MRLSVSLHHLKSAGFTLLEILLAIFIFCIILSAIYASYSGTFRVIGITESQATVYQKARVAMSRISEDLQSSSYSEMVTDREKFVGETEEINRMRAGRLQFLSQAHLRFNDREAEEGKVVIVYEVRQSREEEGTLVLFRHDIPELGKGFEEGEGGLILCDGLVGVVFTFFDAAGNERESWDAASPDFMGYSARSRIPAAVRVRLEFANESAATRPYVFTTSVIIPIRREV